MSGESMAANDALRHIVTKVTDEGLIIEVFDLENEPLFDERNDTPTKTMTEISAIFARVFGAVQNQVAVNGFVRSYPIVLSQSPVWDLSASRADMVRKLLEQDGLPSKRIERVTGYADNRPAAGNPMAIRNNRLELILLREN